MATLRAPDRRRALLCRGTALFAAWVASGAPALGQSARILGRDDAEFARLLLEANYPDLAQGLLALLEKSAKPGATGTAGAEAAKLDLRLELARQEPDLAKRSDLIGRVLEDRQVFLRQHAGTPEAEAVWIGLPEVFGRLAEVLAALLEKESDPVALERIRGRFGNSFVDYEAELRDRIAALEIDRAADPEGEAERQYMIASFNLGRIYFHHARLYPPENPLHLDLLRRTIDAYQQFSIEYSDRLLAFEGFLYQGLALKELGRLDEARKCLDDAIGLRETYERDVKGVYLLPPEAADIVVAAFLQKVLLLSENKDYAAVSLVAKEFLRCVPRPLSTPTGLAVLGAQARAQVDAGDTAGATETARALLAADPRGPWGALGRDILGGNVMTPGPGKGLRLEETLEIAKSLASQGEYDKAIAVCHQLLASARGAEKEADFGAEAFHLVGMIYATRNLLAEASVAFDAAVQRYPKGEKASDALYGGIRCYQRLNAQEKRPFYKRRMEERMRELATKYPESPFAASVQLVEAQDLEDAEDFAGAVALYEKIRPGSAAYEEAQYRAGSGYAKIGRRAFAEGKKEEARAQFAKGEALLKKAIAELDSARTRTVDSRRLALLGEIAFAARLSLAGLLLHEGVARGSDAMPVLDAAEERAGTDAEKLASVWGMRIKAFEAQGKLDDAAKLLDGLLQKNPDTRGLGAAASAIGRAFDVRSAEERAKDPNSPVAQDLLRKAARYYGLGAKSLARGEEVVRTEDLEEIAKRLFAIALQFNEVPDSAGGTFVNWQATGRKAPEPWEQAALLFEAAVSRSPSHRPRLNLGRCYGFLGRWREAARVYAELFEHEPLVDREARRLDAGVLRAKPELLPAYLEWGVAEHRSGVSDGDADGFRRASEIYTLLCSNLPEGHPMWWEAKYLQIRVLVDQGDYAQAEFLLRDLKRSTGEFPPGWKERFRAVEEELSGKVFRQNPK
ncbi:MAG: hypothetical protein L0323_16555 [Planctomycetes bacterium]|nr:hypothetical protein [Planctomycetota bacterium]